MIKSTCNLLIFDKVDVNGNLFPKDMEIDVPEKVPLLSSTGTITNPSDVIGITSARRNENGLEADVIFYDGSEEFENGLKELIQDRKLYIAGYYTAVRFHKKDGIRVIDSMRLASTFITYADVYGNDDLLIQMEEAIVMSRKTKDPKDTLNRYSTLVRQAMSDKYVECAKKKCLLSKEIEIIRRSLDNEKDILPYNRYVELQSELKELEQKYHDQRVMLDIWDQAREICMECADDVFGGEFERFIDIWNSIPEEVRVSGKELERLLRKED